MKKYLLILLCLFYLKVYSQQIELVKDVYPGPDNSYVDNFIALNGKTFFTSYLYHSDRYDPELWITDGTAEGTMLLKGVTNGKPSGIDEYLLSNTLVFKDKLYFLANDSIHGKELWCSNGTPEGTRLVKDVNPGINGSGIKFGKALNNKFFFLAYNELYGYEWWVSNGTSAGTFLILNDSLENENVRVNFISYIFCNDKLFYSRQHTYNESTKIEIWVTDGTSEGTINLTKSLPATTQNGQSDEFIVINDKVYFEYSDEEFGAELWSSDGTISGTKRVLDIEPGPGSSYPKQFINFNNKLVFQTNELMYITDGTTEGTISLSIKSFHKEYAILNDKLIFKGDYESSTFGEELWSTDGTPEGTHLIKDINPGNAPSHISSMTVFQNKLVFKAFDKFNGSEIWISDGTDDGTNTLTNSNADTNNKGSVTYGPLLVYNEKIYYTTKVGDEFRFMVSDGSKSGTHVIPYLGASDTTWTVILFDEQFKITNGSIYFAADCDKLGFELYRIYLGEPLVGISSETIFEKINIFPNPASTSITVSTEQGSGISSYTIYDLMGRPLLKGKINDENSKIDIEQLPDGMYFLTLDEQNFGSFKIIKQ